MNRNRQMRVFRWIVWGAAVVATGYLIYSAISLLVCLQASGQIAYGCAFGAALLILIVLPLPLVVHEAGHLFVGLCCGMRPVCVRLGWLSIARGKFVLSLRNAADGETRFAPRSVRSLRTKLFATALGGAAFNFLYAALCILLVCLLPMTPALFFFAFFVPLSLAEGVCELLPAELPAGKTDGRMMSELVRRTGETEIAVRVLTAQCLCASAPGTCDRSLLFDVPIVREDCPAFIQLLRLQAEYLQAAGDETGAQHVLARLAEIEREEASGGADGEEKEKNLSDDR